MSQSQPILYTVLVFAEPGPKWYRASGQVPRHEAVPIVARHWAKRRLAKLQGGPIHTGAAIVIPFTARADSPYGRNLGR